MSLSGSSLPPLPVSIPHMLSERARATPDREAFVFFDQNKTITYRGLEEEVRRVAAGLSSMGVRKGTHVALMLPNIAEFPFTWLALAWLGAISVQLNPKFTGRELDYVLNDADVDYLVIDETCLSSFDAMEQRSARLPDANIIVCSTDRTDSPYALWASLTDSAPLPEAPRDDVTRHDVVAILYTSGTTGFPKGCMLDHQYWLQIATCALLAQGDHTPRRSLIQEPMFYIQGNAIFVASLLANATVYCPARPSIAKFLGWVQDYAIDYCAIPVPLLHVMEDYPAEMGQSLCFVHAWYYPGGALERLEERFSLVGRDSYAMTENGLCLYVPVDRPDLADRGSVGVPAPGREIRIVDEDGNDVADGETGEVWTAGPGHFHGYYRKTTANRESFQGRWFRTGDLMRRDADGGHYLVGRIKDMIKRSGENISAAEVEGCLARLPGIVMTAVISVPDPERGEEVKAYLCLAPDLTPEDITPQMVFDHCADGLAAFKIPRYLAYVESFPMTASDDKVSKAELTVGIDDLTSGSFDRIDGVWR